MILGLKLDFFNYQVLYNFKKLTIIGNPFKALSLEKCLFNKKLPNSLKKFNAMWSTL